LPSAVLTRPLQLMHENKNSRPTIFLVEEDNNVRPSLTRRLRERGYRLLVSATLEDAFEWTNGTPNIHADLVVIDLLGKLPEEVLSIGRQLREHCNYDQNTPIVVLPEKIPENLEGTDQNVTDAEWICFFADTNQLLRLLARLLNTE
jgi:response regulator RpfG family c-di-GMP phosphodiesterase